MIQIVASLMIVIDETLAKVRIVNYGRNCCLILLATSLRS